MVAKILLDTDPGADDAIALLWLLALDAHYKCELVAITTTAGNVPGARTFDNAARLLSLCHRDDVELGRGVLDSVTTRVRAHGADGLGGVASLLPDASQRYDDAQPADQIIVERVNASPGEITLIGIGPASNLAAAEALQPGTLARAHRIILLGGMMQPAASQDPPEFNVASDPGAWRLVLEQGRDVAVIPIDVTRRVTLASAHVAAAGLDKHGGKIGLFLKALCEAMAHQARAAGVERGFLVHDAAAVACCLIPDMIRLTPARLNVAVDGMARGRTSAASFGGASVMLARSAKAEALCRRLLADLDGLARAVV